MSLTTYGVRIDPDGRVLDTHGRMIPGLFAAGEVTGNVIGQHYLGGGNSVGEHAGVRPPRRVGRRRAR